MGAVDGLYKRLPVFAQNAGITAYGAYWHWLRFGPGFQRAAQGYRERDTFNSEQWSVWTRAQLKALLNLAVGHVPFYRDSWDAQLKDAARAGELEQLPLLSKEPIRAAPYAFVSDNRRGRTYTFHTSGSTGTPVATVWNALEIRDSLAVREVRSANWAGVSFKEPRATFSGRMVVPDPTSSGPFHRFNAIERQVYFSAFHLRPETAAQYVEAIRKHRVRWMTGYAVSFYLLATHILEQGLNVPPLGAIITTSEKLTSEMRVVMEAAYGCRVYEEYSTVENALFSSECEAGRLHVSPDVGVVEILRPDGTACAPGEIGEVVTTSFRPTQIFVRYRLGDLASWDANGCSCGRFMPVIKEVVGRLEDVVTAPDGRQLVRFHGIFVDQPHIREGQIVQEALDHIRVLIVPTPDFDRSDEADVVARMHARLGPEVKIAVERVEAIPRSSSGKFKAVISRIAPTAKLPA